MNTFHDIQQTLIEEIRCAAPDLPVDAVRTDASLTVDLGLDSVHLTSLFANVKQQVGDVELAPWFIRSSRSGTDTVDSLAGYLAERIGTVPAAA